jgi:hypothetical protein
MERLFSSCPRLRDLAESQGEREEIRDPHPEWLQELNLDVSTEAIFSAAERAFTYADLHALLGNEDTVVWLTQHAAVAREDGRVVNSWMVLDGSCRFSFVADGKVIVALTCFPELFLEVCDVVIRLLAGSVVHSLLLCEGSSPGGVSINAPTLAYLMEHCQSLKVLSLQRLELDENQISVLGVHSRPDLEIVLDSCKFTSAGTGALVDILRHNQGLTRLEWCYIDYSVLADGLRGNSRLRSLRQRSINSPETGNQEVLAIAGALRENRGLVHWYLSVRWASDETWGAVCDSLKTHPTLEVLDLSSAYTAGTLTPAIITSRIQSLLDMINVNISIHTLHLDPRYSQHVLFREPVIPYLETNRLRPRLLAIQRTRPITYRAKVLGRALLSTRTDANSFWMLLSGNPEVAFPLTTVTTTPAIASLPTSAAASTSSTATSNAASTRDTSAAGASAAANAHVNVAAPTACQKRKACSLS